MEFVNCGHFTRTAKEGKMEEKISRNKGGSLEQQVPHAVGNLVVGSSQRLQHQTANGGVEKLGVSHDKRRGQELRVDAIVTVFFAVLVIQPVIFFQNEWISF